MTNDEIEAAEFFELVTRTRHFMRVAGWYEFDESFENPGHYRDMGDPAGRVLVDPSVPEGFLYYLEVAAALLGPITLDDTVRLQQELNRCLQEPVTRIVFVENDGVEWNLLAPETYESSRLVRETLLTIFRELRWDPPPALREAHRQPGGLSPGSRGPKR